MKSHDFEIFIQLPKTAIQGIILMNIEATSGNSIDQGPLVKKNATLVIMVCKLDKAKEPGTTIEDIWISILFLIIIIIIICILILLMKRKKKDNEEEEPLEEAVTIKPSAEPAAVITIEQDEQLPDTQSQEQLPETTKTDATQMQEISSPVLMAQLPTGEIEKKENIHELDQSEGRQDTEE